ncbi:MAG TPA: TrkH family potassium uptake protein [Candidatus Hypogeohydataceae bacterium YC40]
MKKEAPFTEPSELKEKGIQLGYSEADTEDTVKYLEEQEKLYVSLVDITKGKLAGMLAITWLTIFPGLLNLVFLRRDKSQRAKSIIALSINLTVALPLSILAVLFTEQFEKEVVKVMEVTSWSINFCLAIWMTVEACRAYKRSKMAKGVVKRSYGVKLTPIQLLVLGYILVVLIGASVLTLPISTSSRKHEPFIDALFVATSGISTTGLSPVDVGSFYSLFGQMTLLVIFQIGGVSYVTFFIFIAYTLGLRPPLIHKLVAKEAIAGAEVADIFKFFKFVLIFTFLFEFAGAAILSIYWMHEFSVPRSIHLGIFHSVSGFCTAGFGLFPDSLESYRGSIIVNVTIFFLTILGGIGFFVLYDLYAKFKKFIKHEYPRELSVHTKLAIIVTAIILSIGFLVIFFSEKWSPEISLKDRILASFFQTINASTTTGFDTIDIAGMGSTALFMLILLMFIGASPGSTGGGIKTTTLGVIFASTLANLKKTYVNLFRKRIPDDTIHTAFAIFYLFSLVVVIDTLILTFTEDASFLQILFETVSALGNVGLSMGITSHLTVIGKILLTITMFIGRVGPLIVGLFLFGRPKHKGFEYVEAKIFVG